MVKDAYYFSHDSNARHDPKLSALIKDFGFSGYGLYWGLIEIMHEQGGKIEKFPKLYEGLAQELRSSEADLKRLISASINDFHLLKEDATHLWSERVLRNKQALQDKRTQRVDAGRLGGIASGVSRGKTKQNEAPLEANEQKESKVKKSKVLKKPSIKAIKEYCQERNNTINAQTFFDHYEANVWMRGNNSIKDWKATIRTWESREQKGVKHGKMQPLKPL